MQGTQQPLFPPEQGPWTTPKSLPILSDKITEVAVDLETKDPFLKEKGPGTFRKDGHVVGFSVACDQFKIYVPIRHCDGNYHDPVTAIRWFGDIMGKRDLCKVGSNIPYDIEWADMDLGITTRGPLFDTTFAEALIDEESKSVGLEACSMKYLGVGKDEELLKQAADAFGVNPKSELWKLPAKYVGQYGLMDAVRTLETARHQRKELIKQELCNVMIMECDLIPIMWKTRKRGVRIDEEQSRVVSAQYKVAEDDLLKRIETFSCNKGINPWSADDLGKACDVNHIDYPLTKKTGKPSFTTEFLKVSDHRFLKEVREWRTINRLRTVYIDSLIKEYCIKGRIHAQANQLKGDENGTRSGRFSYTNPNLQQTPARDDLARAIRGLFISDPGSLWGKFDYSQQEPRIMVHFAQLMGFDKARDFLQAYKNNPDTDFYKIIQGEAGIIRFEAKTLSLGRSYGMGVKSMSEQLNCELKKAKETLAKFDGAAPFIGQLFDSVEKRAKDVGYIKTILGRRGHFNMYEPTDAWRWRTMVPPRLVHPLRFSEASKKWPTYKLMRANTRNAFNRLIQGSAADMVKKAILNIYNETGIYPYITVHDEVDNPIENEKQAKQVAELMRDAIPEITVPMKVDIDLGRCWK